MIRRPPRSTLSSSSAASDVYKRQMYGAVTEQCVGLEVVLPTGEIIDTGAKANSFRDKPFTRFGLGADYSGLFLGDVGIHGVKTKASFNIYPLPEYRGYATY